MSLGGPELPGINGVKVDAFGWEQTAATDTVLEWRTNGGVLSVNYFPLPPDLVRLPGNDEALRRQFEPIEHDDNSAILEAGWISLGGLVTAKVILKVRLQAAMSYLGSITIPFEACSWVVKVQFVEVGPTGMREALVFDSFLAEGHSIGNWSPGAGTVAGDKHPGVTILPSDAARWDSVVPGHPLTRLRQALDGIERDTVVTDAVKQLPPFAAG